MTQLLAILISLPLAAMAAPWDFRTPVTIRGTDDGVFYHLGAGGRSAIGVSGGLVAIAWEAARAGKTSCFVALLEPRSGEILREYRINERGNAYEPAVIGIGNRRFAVAWEQDAHVWMRLLGPAALGDAIRLDRRTGAHASLAWLDEDRLVAVWSERAERIWMADFELAHEAGLSTRIRRRIQVEPGPTHGSQTYPSVTSMGYGQLTVAWEDRRLGHSAIFVTTRHPGGGFAPPTQLNESFWGGRDLGYGRGTGAMRVALAANAHDAVAVWADKRDFRHGYDVYAAFAKDGGRFGPNQKVQDAFGDDSAQWHPSIAAGGGALAVVWDDDRDGTDDIWLSWPEDGTWSDDLDVPGASGAGFQSEPALALDEHGGLHLAWIHSEDGDGSRSQIRYLYAPSSE